MSELKPCPFCGEKAEVRYSSENVFGQPYPYFSVQCTNRMCLARTMAYDVMFEAIEAWNRRVKDGDE